jgi:hypothetical protein
MKTITLLVALLALAGCTKQIDGAKLEKNIAEEVEKQTKHKPKSVTCPKDIVEKEGGTFQCTATADDGSTVPVDVTMQGGGNVKWEIKPSAKAEK